MGGGPLTELQAAWAGGDYIDEGQDPVYSTEEMLLALNMSEDNQPGLMIDWLVGAIGAEAKRQKIDKQFKPWPDPLPPILSMTDPIDASYIEGHRIGEEVVIEPAVGKWISYTRGKGKKQRPDDCVSEEGLRFDDSVPVKTIVLPVLEAQGLHADQFEVFLGIGFI